MSIQISLTVHHCRACLVVMVIFFREKFSFILKVTSLAAGRK